MAEDKTRTFSSEQPKANEDKKKQNKEEKTYSEYEEDTKFFFADPHTEKIEKLQNQLDKLMQKKDLKVARVSRLYPLEWGFVSFLEKYKPLKLELYDGKYFPSQHIYYFTS